jgi:[ribosomal protein S18]-alanine N-acetyltransferase
VRQATRAPVATPQTPGSGVDAPGSGMDAPGIRPYQASDLDALYHLDQVCFPPGVAYSRAEIAGYLRRSDSKAWIAEASAGSPPEIAGFVIASCDRRRQGHIITLDVAPAWRRRAVGSMLMDTAEAWVRRRGGTAVYLETAEDNLTAQAFYLHRGYSRLQRIEDYYGKGQAAFLMGKEIVE